MRRLVVGGLLQVKCPAEPWTVPNGSLESTTGHFSVTKLLNELRSIHRKGNIPWLPRSLIGGDMTREEQKAKAKSNEARRRSYPEYLQDVKKLGSGASLLIFRNGHLA